MSAFLILIYAICGIYMVLNFKYDIQMLQQNSYRISRYWRWLQPHTASAWRLVDMAMLFLLFATILPMPLRLLVIAMVCLGKCALILRRKYKKPLVMTRRVWRIYGLTALLSAGGYLAVILCTRHNTDASGWSAPEQVSLATLLLITIFSWAVVIAAVWLLQPVESMINRRYYRDAQRILAQMPDLKIIGITGSYGKTSTKHFLNRILSEKYDVLMTPGSYNTPMGVIRTVREMMRPYNEVFICEMGAKQKGDIKEICDLVHPDMGIITAVGPMHLETFKTIDCVQSTKFELADALPADGLVAVNNDFEYCANRNVDNVAAKRYGVSGNDNCDYWADEIKYGPTGTSFVVKGKDGTELPLETRLLGECNISDLLGAVVIARALGVTDEKIQYAVKSITPVEHRLSIKQTPGGVTILDDAFNSNPEGSRMAVEVLGQFTEGQRIIVTPGMIELGSRQFDLNRELGVHIGHNADIVIVVGEYNREAISRGIASTDFPEENMYLVGSFNDAQQMLATLLKRGDTVLYENDLPDTFK